RRRHTRFHVTGVQTCALPISPYRPGRCIRSGCSSRRDNEMSTLPKLFAAATCLVMLLAVRPGTAQMLIVEQDPVTVSNNLLAHMQAGEFDAAAGAFSPEMLAAVPAARLAETWNAVPGQLGALKSVGEPVSSRSGAMTEVVTPLHFERMALESRVVVDTDGRVVGFRIAPAP